MTCSKRLYNQHLCCIIIFTALLSFCATAQKLSAFQNYTFISDFTQNSVQTIHQDKAGYIWIGTESGLNKYDGRRITSYKIGLNNNFTLTSKRINQITEDKEGNLWLATSGGGINIIAPKKNPAENNQLKVLADSLNRVMATDFVGCIKILRNNTVVMGMDSGICTYDPVKKRIIKIPEFNYGSLHIRCDVVKIEEDNKGRCIVASSTGGVFILDNNFNVIHYFEPGLFGQGKSLQVIDILFTPGNLLFISSAAGVYKVYTDAGKPPVRLSNDRDIDLSILRVNSMAYDPLNKWILLGSNTTGVVTIDTSGKIADHLFDNKQQQKLHSNTVYSFLIDAMGLGYWVGTRSGLCKFFWAEDKFSSFQVKDNEDGSSLPIYPIYTEDNVHILTGTARSLVVHNLFSGEKKDIQIPGNNSLRFNSISKFTDGLYLYGTRDGIYYSNSYISPVINKLSIKYPELKFADKFNILCFLPLNKEEILIGAKGDDIGGLILWNKSKRTVAHFLHVNGDTLSLPDNTINYMAAFSNNKVIICMNKGVCYFNPSTKEFKRIFHNTNTVLNYSHVTTIMSKQNTLWIGTYGGGLNKYNIDDDTIEYITEDNGLANNELYSIQEGKENEYWLSSNRGLILYNSAQKKIRNFDKSYGLINNEFNRASTFKCRDTIYFGGLSGLNYFNYKKFKDPISPPGIDVSQIAVLNALVEKVIFTDSLNKLKVTYQENTLKFYLASPFYINPAKTEFYYRLLPNQKEWVNNGINNELIITQLPPGLHQLELKTKNSEGIYSSVKKIYIAVTPPWYQTWWFRLLLALLIISIFYGFYKMRIAQLKKENQIRNQLATDLHDDLGSTLNSVKVYSNLAMMEKENGSHLMKIKESTQDAIAGVRDLIWVLDDKKDTIQDLLSRINQFAAPVCEVNHIELIQKIDDALYYYKLGKEEKRNLYMIIKESINNSIKYSGCHVIELKAALWNKTLKISISDNGKGFNIEKIKKGYGLKNITNRAKEIGYKNEIISSPGNGATIILIK